MAVTVTVYVWGSGGPELSPPHAADIVAMAMASILSNHNPRRFLDTLYCARHANRDELDYWRSMNQSLGGSEGLLMVVCVITSAVSVLAAGANFRARSRRLNSL